MIMGDKRLIVNYPAIEISVVGKKPSGEVFYTPAFILGSRNFGGTIGYLYLVAFNSETSRNRQFMDVASLVKMAGYNPETGKVSEVHPEKW